MVPLAFEKKANACHGLRLRQVHKLQERWRNITQSSGLCELGILKLLTVNHDFDWVKRVRGVWAIVLVVPKLIRISVVGRDHSRTANFIDRGQQIT